MQIHQVHCKLKSRIKHLSLGILSPKVHPIPLFFDFSSSKKTTSLQKTKEGSPCHWNPKIWGHLLVPHEAKSLNSPRQLSGWSDGFSSRKRPGLDSSFEKIKEDVETVLLISFVLHYHIYIYRVYTCNVRNFQDTVRTCIYVFSFFMYTSLLKKHYINHHIYWRKTEWKQRLFISISEPSGCGALVFSNKCSGSTFCRAELSFHDQWGVLYGYDWKWLEPE